MSESFLESSKLQCSVWGSSTKHLAFAFAITFALSSPFGNAIFLPRRAERLAQRRLSSRSREPEREEESDPEDDFVYQSDSEEAERLEESEPQDDFMFLSDSKDAERLEESKPQDDFMDLADSEDASGSAFAFVNEGNCNNVAASAFTNEGKGVKGKGKKDCEDPDANAFVKTKGKGKNDFEDPTTRAVASRTSTSSAVASRTLTPTPSHL